MVSGIPLNGDPVPTAVIQAISRQPCNDIDFKCCHCTTLYREADREKVAESKKYEE